jgi:PRTRC genetic system protein B
MKDEMPQHPRLRLDFYPSAVLMSRWEKDGRLTAYPVSVHDVVSACTHVDLSSGLLPPNTLFWKQQANQVMLGIYVPARRWKVQTEESSYHVPMPPFLFVGNGTSYRIFAVKKRPRSERDQIYHAPCPNVHTHGGICQGNTPFPVCRGQTIQQALYLFLEGSLFNADLSRGKCQSHPEDVRQLWRELDGRKKFPLAELVSMRIKLRDLL